MGEAVAVKAYLVPINEEEEREGCEIPKIPLAAGTNTVGRTNLPLPHDKRVSRTHLSLSLPCTFTSTSTAKLTPEGSNPVVVVKSIGGERKKVSKGEEVSVSDGDIIELIPGHHLFKYVAVASHAGRHNDGKRRTRDSTDGQDVEQDRLLQKKKLREAGFGVDNANCLKAETHYSGADSCEEQIRNFRIPDDQLPLTFRLLKVQGLPPWANNSCVSITDVVQGDIVAAIFSNYMVDIDWLLSACPTLAKIPHVMIVHGEGDSRSELMKRTKLGSWILHRPPLPISFGTHHSKAMLLVYPRGVRIIVHTANLIYVDWNNKSQGLWMQDFPWKDERNLNKGCAFETDLVDYLTALKWPEFNVKLPALGNVNINPAFFRKFDYTSAAVRLIASVPGYHTGGNLKKWGHMKLRSVLQECTFDKEFKSSPLAYQFSSLGSLDEKWMTEFATSVSSGFTEGKSPLGLGESLIVWPSVEDVRCSLEGYAAGNAIPSPLKNVEKGFLRKYWAKWKATHTGRCHAMPHIKTFTRYSGQNLAWLLLTSSNLSKAAWGALQKNNSQLMIRSYELGVLFLPSHVRKHGSGFSCTKSGSQPKDNCADDASNSEVLKPKLVTLQWQGMADSSTDVIRLPLPYELPLQRYSSEDVPWSWDRRYSKKDVYGQVWPRHVQLYSSDDS